MVMSTGTGGSRSGIRGLGLVLLATTVLLAPQMVAADERAERAVATRQGALKLMGFYMAPLGGMARGRMELDAAMVERNAQRISALAPMLTDTFRFDTSGSDVASDAKPGIWTDGAAFQGKIETLIEKAADLSRIAGGDSSEGEIKGGIGALGQACGSCHDDFRIKRD